VGVRFFCLLVSRFFGGWSEAEEARCACGASRVGTWLVEVEGLDSPVKIIL
jgi:hypothetical protein